MVEDKNYEIGCRIDCDGYRGTIKYVGSVGNTKGQWLGIDWDDPTRGKHNGTHEGIEYFKTRHPTSGSFIRPEKANLGVSCPEAIKVRYGLVEDELAGFDRDNLSTFQKKIKVPVEMVGFSKVNKKQSRFENLCTILLREQNVSSAGRPGELHNLCPFLEELDLSRNLISSWSTVTEICNQLRNLKILNVSGNCLPTDENLDLGESFPAVCYLTMATMGYDWLDVEKCCTMFREITKLDVSCNNIRLITEPADQSNLMKLEHLTLTENYVQSWNEILKLGRLSRLEYLNLSSNEIDKIRIPTDEPTGKTQLFAGLKILNISKNNLSDWQSIRELEKLAQLTSLKITDNPVLKTVTTDTAFQIIVSSISSLKYYNGHEIQDQEKRGAEYDYLKFFGLQWLECKDDPEKKKEFLSAHPRYLLLIQKYGELDVPAPQAKLEMASNVITVEFTCPNDPSQPKGVKRKLLKDMNVQKVIGLAQRLFKTGGKMPELSFVQQKLSEDEIPLDKPLQELCYYSIEDGDHILVRW